MSEEKVSSDEQPLARGDFTLDEFLSRAGARLLMHPPNGGAVGKDERRHGDHALSPELISEVAAGAATPAAVLIPIVARGDGATVLFTRRASGLRNHSVRSPSRGRIDAGDDSPLDAALREAEEEIGLGRRVVRLLGYGDLYFTTSGYRVAPVVGLVAADFSLLLNPSEVEDTFECPLAFLMNPDNHRRESREWRGGMRSYYAMRFGEHYIWGVTAGILRNLYERVYR